MVGCSVLMCPHTAMTADKHTEPREKNSACGTHAHSAAHSLICQLLAAAFESGFWSFGGGFYCCMCMMYAAECLGVSVPPHGDISSKDGVLWVLMVALVRKCTFLAFFVLFAVLCTRVLYAACASREFLHISPTRSHVCAVHRVHLLCTFSAFVPWDGLWL